MHFVDGLAPERTLGAPDAHPLRRRLRAKLGRLVGIYRICASEAIDALADAEDALGQAGEAGAVGGGGGGGEGGACVLRPAYARASAHAAVAASPPPAVAAWPGAQGVGFDGYGAAFNDFRTDYLRKMEDDTLWLPVPIASDPLLLRWFSRISTSLNLPPMPPGLVAETLHPPEELAKLRASATRWHAMRAARADVDAHAAGGGGGKPLSLIHI